MRKFAFILVIVMLVTTLAVPTLAAQPRTVTITPSLTFEGTTAKCNASIVGNNITDELSAVVRLYRNGTLIATWVASGEGYIFFSKEKTVQAGYTYKLEVTLTINGSACTPVFVEKSC